MAIDVWHGVKVGRMIAWWWRVSIVAQTLCSPRIGITILHGGGCLSQGIGHHGSSNNRIVCMRGLGRWTHLVC
jgi:hypothetical protein